MFINKKTKQINLKTFYNVKLLLILFLLFLNCRENTIFWSNHYDRLWSSLKSGSYLFCGLNKICLSVCLSIRPSVRPSVYLLLLLQSALFLFFLSSVFFFLSIIYLFLLFLLCFVVCFDFCLNCVFENLLLLLEESELEAEKAFYVYLYNIIGIYYTKIVLFYFFRYFS